METIGLTSVLYLTPRRGRTEKLLRERSIGQGGFPVLHSARRIDHYQTLANYKLFTEDEGEQQ